MSATTTSPCALHPTHSPTNLTVELHHVVPQAWQHVWQPALAKLDTNGLWDPRTVAICPTGHRNVHALIVRLMKMAASTQDEKVFLAQTAPGDRPRGHHQEFETALLALERWYAEDGKLLDLTAAGQWGEA